MTRRILLLIAFALLLPGLVAVRADDLAKKVDKVFAEYDKADSPGCALGVIRDGRLIYERGYGMANLEYGIPITSFSVFRIGSVSKQFAAMAIALLAEQGKISLNDDIRKYFPEMPDYGNTVTIRRLIHHTSGVRDYLTLMRLAGKSNDDFYTDEDVVEMLARQKELNFAPGAEWLYSNAGYFLLAQIVLRATGQTLRKYAEENMFGPLGMKDTHFHDDHTHIVKNRASGYSPRKEGGFRINMTTLGMVGDGGVYTTVRDMLIWDQNFYNNKLGQKEQELIKLVETPGRLNDGKELDYAFGLRVAKYRGLKTVGHGGSFVGFRAATLRFPEKKFSVVALCNLSRTNPSRLAQRVADVYLAGQFVEVVMKAETRPGVGIVGGVAVSQTHTGINWISEWYEGEYYSEELQVTYRIQSVNGGGLFFTHRNAPDGTFLPIGRDRFRVDRLEIEFERDPDKPFDPATGFRLHAGRVRNIRFIKK